MQELSGRTCHMAMPQCCYLAKGAKRPSHSTNMLTSSNISVIWSIWSTHLVDTFVAHVTDAILSPKWLPDPLIPVTIAVDRFFRNRPAQSISNQFISNSKSLHKSIHLLKTLDSFDSPQFINGFEEKLLLKMFWCQSVSQFGQNQTSCAEKSFEQFRCRQQKL